MARRVVGFLEYGKALDYLDRLVSMSDAADLEAIDAIIGDRDEFAIFRELPPGFEPDQESQNAVNKDKPELAGSKRGLAWLIALARVEFGAVVSGFTDHPNPYMFVQPDNYAYAETMQLLLEGVVSHYTALQREEALEDYMSKNNGVQAALTLSRRLRIARSMMRPIMQPERSRYSTAQARQLETAAKDLDTAQTGVNNAIRTWLASTQKTETSQETVTREFVTACGQQISAERREIQAGTAQVWKRTEDGPGHSLDIKR